MASSIKARLSAMMFLQYFINGCFLPILSHYLKNHLGFTPFQVGVVMAMPAIAAIVAPFLMVRFADRLLSAERLLALNQFIAAALMLALFYQKSYLPFLVLYFLHGVAFIPTFALTNAVAFHHLADARRDFGIIRMWGPISWVVVGWGFGFLWLRGGGIGIEDSRLPQALVLSAAASLVLGVYSLTLPQSSVARDRARQLGMWHSAAVFLKPNMALLCVLTLLNALVHQLYYYGMSPFLHQVGFADKYIMPAMSMGQFGEVFAMLVLGRCLAHLGFKRMLLIGVLAQALRCVAFMTQSKLLILLVIPSHGLCYAFFFAVAYIYLDRHCSRENRAGAQQFFNIIIAGLGNLAGNLAAGKVADWATDSSSGQIGFPAFWGSSIVLAFGIGIVLAFLFNEEEEEIAVTAQPQGSH